MNADPDRSPEGAFAPAHPQARLLETEGHLRALGLGAVIYGGYVFFVFCGILREPSLLWRNDNGVLWILMAWSGAQIPAGVGLFFFKRWARPILVAVFLVGIMKDIWLLRVPLYALPWMFVHVGGFYMLINSEGSRVLSPDYQRVIVGDRTTSVQPMLLSPFLWIPVFSIAFFEVVMKKAFL